MRPFLPLLVCVLATLGGCNLLSAMLDAPIQAGQLPAEGNYNLVMDVVHTYEDYLDADTTLTPTELSMGHIEGDALAALFDRSGMVSAALAVSYSTSVFTAHDAYVLSDDSLSIFKQSILLDNTIILRESFQLALDE